MKWTDIEAKWDAMTRRVQSDRPQDQIDLRNTLASEQPPLLRDEMSDQRAHAPHDRSAT